MIGWQPQCKNWLVSAWTHNSTSEKPPKFLTWISLDAKKPSPKLSANCRSTGKVKNCAAQMPIAIPQVPKETMIALLTRGKPQIFVNGWETDLLVGMQKTNKITTTEPRISAPHGWLVIYSHGNPLEWGVLLGICLEMFKRSSSTNNWPLIQNPSPFTFILFKPKYQAQKCSHAALLLHCQIH